MALNNWEMRAEGIYMNRHRLCIIFTVVLMITGGCLISRKVEHVVLPSIYPILQPGLERFMKQQHCICINCKGGIGNEMFQLASSYGIARRKNMTVVISKNCKLLSIFKLSAFLSVDISMCSHYKKIKEINGAVYDPMVLEFDNEFNIYMIGYLQAYRYFDKYNIDIRKQFSFTDKIKTKAEKLLHDIFERYNLTCQRNVKSNKDYLKENITCYDVSNDIVTIIGIHVRRGDWLLPPHPEAGFQTASREYFHRAVEWYQNIYSNIFFILATNGIDWTKQNMPGNISIVYLEGNTAEIDMAILTSCNHFIASTGTFSWWIGWLIGGNVTYYKWPAREHTPFRETFGKNYSDHFYPWWIGL